MGDILKKYAAITSGTALMALSIAQFLLPNNIAPGGTSGLTVIINALTGISAGIIMMAINIPGLVIGIWKFGLKSVIGAVYSSVLCSLLIDLLSRYPSATSDVFLATVFGAVIMGIGVGIIFKTGTMTAGFDLIVLCIQQKYKHIRISLLFLASNIIIIGFSGLIFGNINYSLFAVICNYIMAKSVDSVLYSSDFSKVLYIISDKHEMIAEKLSQELRVGFTYVDGKGSYSEKNKRVILCAIKNSLYPKVKDAIKEVDPDAFTIVSQATDVYGQNFKSYSAFEL